MKSLTHLLLPSVLPKSQSTTSLIPVPTVAALVASYRRRCQPPGPLAPLSPPPPSPHWPPLLHPRAGRRSPIPAPAADSQVPLSHSWPLPPSPRRPPVHRSPCATLGPSPRPRLRPLLHPRTGPPFPLRYCPLPPPTKATAGCRDAGGHVKEQDWS
jgi:hypothetical protein